MTRLPPPSTEPTWSDVLEVTFYFLVLCVIIIGILVVFYYIFNMMPAAVKCIDILEKVNVTCRKNI